MTKERILQTRFDSIAKKLFLSRSKGKDFEVDLSGLGSAPVPVTLAFRNASGGQEGVALIPSKRVSAVNGTAITYAGFPVASEIYLEGPAEGFEAQVWISVLKLDGTQSLDVYGTVTVAPSDEGFHQVLLSELGDPTIVGGLTLVDNSGGAAVMPTAADLHYIVAVSAQLA